MRRKDRSPCLCPALRKNDAEQVLLSLRALCVVLFLPLAENRCLRCEQKALLVFFFFNLAIQMAMKNMSVLFFYKLLQGLSFSLHSPDPIK